MDMKQENNNAKETNNNFFIAHIIRKCGLDHTKDLKPHFKSDALTAGR